MKINIFIYCIISILVLSCNSDVEINKRPEGKLIYGGLTFFNAPKAIRSYRKSGSTSGGSGVDTTNKGEIEVSKDKIIIQYQESIIPDFNNKKVTLNILSCKLGKNDDYGQKYKYTCDNGDFEIIVGSNGVLKSATAIDGDETIGFIPKSAFKK